MDHIKNASLILTVLYARKVDKRGQFGQKEIDWPQKDLNLAPQGPELEALNTGPQEQAS